MSPKQISLILSILAGSSIVEAADEIPAKPTRSLFSCLCCCFCSAPPEEPIKLTEFSYIPSSVTTLKRPSPCVLVPQDEDSEEEKHSTKSPSAHPLDLHSALGQLADAISDLSKPGNPIPDLDKLVSNIVVHLDLNFPPEVLSKDKELRGLLHDIRQGLNDIKSGFEFLKENNQDLETIEGLKNNIPCLTSLIGKALEMPDGSVRETKKTPESIFHLAKSSLSCCSLSARKTGVDLSCVLPETLEDFVLTRRTDSMTTKRILYNLIKNALLYSQKEADPSTEKTADSPITPSTPSVTLAIETQEIDHQWMAKFLVTDRGIGMSAKFMSESLFTEGAREGTTKQKGSGTGLNSCKELVENMGGNMGATSEGIGKGSTFWFTVPVTCVKSVFTNPAARKLHNQQLRMQALQDLALQDTQVLVVDDSGVSRQLLVQQCKRLGMRKVSGVGTVQDALDFTAQTPPSLVFMDTNLNDKDGVDGVELTKKIRESTPPQRRIPRTISISGDAQTPEQLKQNGMHGSLSKPFDQKRLRQLLEEHAEFALQPVPRSPITKKTAMLSPSHPEEPAGDTANL